MPRVANRLKNSARVSDKILFVQGLHAGQRGTIAATSGQNRVTVRLTESGENVEAELFQIRNFSAAARQAWKTAPSRRVGRPAGRSSSRISVTLRIDASLWERFRDFEAHDVIADRSAFVESALAQALEPFGEPGQ